MGTESAGFEPVPGSELPLGPLPGEEPAPAGYFAEIAFFGHIEHVGYVTEVTLHGGQAAYRIDLPEKLWGGNPLAWREYAASAFFEKNPVTEETVRAQWEAEREQAERWRLQQAEWERRAPVPALTAGDEEDEENPF
jgi:hypothetical protein